MATKKTQKPKADDCVIPMRPNPEFLRASLVESSPREEAATRVTSSGNRRKIPKGQHLLNTLSWFKSEFVFGREYKVWDVHATDGRWWVVTNPTNLYSQEHIPSLDFVLSLHVGLMARVASEIRVGPKVRISNGSPLHGVAGASR